MKNSNFDKNHFEVIREAVSSDVIEYVSECFDIHEKTSLRYRPPTPLNPYPYGDEQSPNSFSWYASLYGESMLRFLKNKISEVINKQIVETYSYIRIYYEGAVLEKHMDRPSCEYSATICVKKTSDWPIYFETTQGKVVGVELNPGDMIVYRGNILNHWRDCYSGEYHQQMFLHYVDLNGPYAKTNEYDGRPLLGCSMNERIRETQ